MDVKEKIQIFLDAKGVKPAQLERQVGLSNGYWRKTKSISAKCVEDILRTYPELSSEWLFRDEGEMIVEKPQPTSVGEAYYQEMLKEMEAMKDRLDNLEGKVS